MIKKVYQQNLKDCGVACLISILKYYKGNNTFNNIRQLTKCNENGITALNLIEASKKLGFKARGLKCEYNDLNNLVKPLICHVVIKNIYNHYIVIYKVNKKHVIAFDPYYGVKKYTKAYFLKIWDNIVIELKPYKKLDNVKDISYKKITKILRKYNIIYLFVIVFSFISIILTVINNLYFKTLIDGYNTISILLFFSITIVIKESNDFIRNSLLIKLENEIDKEISINTHSNILSLPKKYFSSRTNGEVITKFNDLEHIKNLLVRFSLFSIIDIIMIIITSLILISINKKLSIIFFALCFVYFSIMLLFDKKIKKMIKLNQENNSIKNSILLENISSINTIKNMNIKDYRNNYFENVLRIFVNSNIQYEKTYNSMNLVKNIILLIGLNIMLFLGIGMVNRNFLSLSDLILFDTLLMYFIEPLKDIFDLNPILKNGINALKRVSEIYDFENNTKEHSINTYDIKFTNLNFSYDGYHNIINNFNYNILFKDKLFVVGESGSGKSTLFSLLNKSYEIEDGSITIGSVDIKELNISSYITYVSQDERIFNDTIYKNIVFDGDKDITDIVKLVKIDKLLKNRGLTLNSLIDEEGKNLSKGEKQKIILARALLKESKIIILDEALSGVDNKDEYEIMRNILKKFSDKTIIYISHSMVCSNLFEKTLKIGN